MKRTVVAVLAVAAVVAVPQAHAQHRHRWLRALRHSFALLAAALLLCAPAWAQLYDIEDLGTLGGKWSGATAINAAGHVAGTSETAAGNQRTFLWPGTREAGGGTMRDLGTLGGRNSVALGITNTGRVVGSAQRASGEWHPVLWGPDYTRDLGIERTEYGMATDMNDFGVAVGWAEYGDGLPIGILWTPVGVRLTLEVPYPVAVNAAGHVIGVDDNYYTEWALLWRGGEILEIGHDVPRIEPLASSPQPVDINASDQVVLNTDWRWDPVRAWLWTDGQVRDLGSLGAGNTFARAINDAGAVVGTSDWRAFLYTNAGGMVDLNTCLGSRSDWFLGVAADINNAGQIVGAGYHNGQWRAFRLTPVPARRGRPANVHTYP